MADNAMFRRMPTPYRYLRCGDLRYSGSHSGATVHSDYATMMMMMMMIKMHTYRKFILK